MLGTQKRGPGDGTPAGPWPVQLRYETGLTGEEYVRAEAWRDARLERCPNHPHGGCSVACHGTYARKTPRGAKIARWYCRGVLVAPALAAVDGDALAAAFEEHLNHAFAGADVDLAADVALPRSGGRR